MVVVGGDENEAAWHAAFSLRENKRISVHNYDKEKTKSNRRKIENS